MPSLPPREGKSPAFVRQINNPKDVNMDWIERLFGFSPDGGDGSTEMLYLIAAVAAVALIFGRSFFVRRARKLRD